MTEKQYELAVIGAGPGGYEAAVCAGRLGKRTAIIECGEIGGTCLNRGCIPTKVLLHASRLYREVRDGEAIGIMAENAEFDMGRMHGRKDEVILKMRRGIDHLLKTSNVDVYRGRAVVSAPGKLSVSNDGETIEIHADRILIAAGGKPSVPPFEGSGLAGVMTSDDVLNERDRVFDKLAIIGGGVIGLEFASLYSDLGCEVVVIEAMDRILPAMDPEISQTLATIFKRRGIGIHTSAKVEKIENQGNLKITCSIKGKTQDFEAGGVLVATGRKADTEGLFGPGIDIEMNGSCIRVDDDFKTSVEGIHAVGDVVGGMQLAHLAAAQGINAVCRMFGEKDMMDLSAVPACVYTDPEIATVGLTLEEALSRGMPAKSAKYQMISNARSVMEFQDRSFIKIVFDGETGRVLGAQLVSGRAADMIGELTSAVRAGLTVKQLAASIRPHPTFSEGISKALEAALELGPH